MSLVYAQMYFFRRYMTEHCIQTALTSHRLHKLLGTFVDTRYTLTTCVSCLSFQKSTVDTTDITNRAKKHSSTWHTLAAYNHSRSPHYRLSTSLVNTPFSGTHMPWDHIIAVAGSTIQIHHFPVPTAWFTMFNHTIITSAGHQWCHIAITHPPWSSAKQGLMCLAIHMHMHIPPTGIGFCD